MILEVAHLTVRTGQNSAFEQAFAVHRPHWRAQLAAHFASRG